MTMAISKTTNNPYEYFRLNSTIYSSVYQSNKYLSMSLEIIFYVFKFEIVDKLYEHLISLIEGYGTINAEILQIKILFNPMLGLETITTDQGPFTPALTPFSFISTDGFYTDFLTTNQDYQKSLFSKK